MTPFALSWAGGTAERHFRARRKRQQVDDFPWPTRCCTWSNAPMAIAAASMRSSTRREADRAKVAQRKKLAPYLSVCPSRF